MDKTFGCSWSLLFSALFSLNQTSKLLPFVWLGGKEEGGKGVEGKGRKESQILVFGWKKIRMGARVDGLCFFFNLRKHNPSPIGRKEVGEKCSNMH